jgi:DNA-binding HxlR family transcriptional regulator
MSDPWQSSSPFLRLLGPRWTMPLLAALVNRGCRYQELHDALDGISHKVLTDTLRRAERDGLIARQIDPGRVETATLYALTELGRSLDTPLTELGRWVEANWHEVEAAHRHWDSRRKNF